MPCGMFSLVILGCLGLCLDELSTCMLIGGLPAALRMLLCGKWYLRVFWSIFERKRMTKILKAVREHCRRFKSFSSKVCIFGWLLLFSFSD